MLQTLLESLWTTMGVASGTTYLLAAISGYALVECLRGHRSEKPGHASFIFQMVSIFALFLSACGIAAGFMTWGNMRPSHYLQAVIDAALVFAQLRLAWSLASFAGIAGIVSLARVVRIAGEKALTQIVSGTAGVRASIIDRIRLRLTLRALRGIEWEKTRRHIRTVVVEFLPELRSNRAELSRQISRTNRRLSGPSVRVHKMNAAVRGLYDQACGVRDELFARLQAVDAKIQDCEDFVEITATLAETSPTEVSDVTVRFDQLAEEVAMTRSEMDRTREELQAPNVHRLPSRQHS